MFYSYALVGLIVIAGLIWLLLSLIVGGIRDLFNKPSYRGISTPLMGVPSQYRSLTVPLVEPAPDPEDTFRVGGGKYVVHRSWLDDPEWYAYYGSWRREWEAWKEGRDRAYVRACTAGTQNYDSYNIEPRLLDFSTYKELASRD